MKIRQRYQRQGILIGEKEQRNLEKSAVCVVGLGGTGGIAAELLARAGVNLILIDKDKVSEDNLHRQILFAERDVGAFKAEIAEKVLKKINSEIRIEHFCIELGKNNAEKIFQCNVVLDCTDNMRTRYLINEICFGKIPWIHTAAIGYEGVVAVFSKNGKPCFKCLYQKMPKPCDLETCETFGVLGGVPNLIGCVAATEAIKILLGKAEFGFMQRYDAQKGVMEKLKIQKNKKCEICG